MTREQAVCDLTDLFVANIREYGYPYGYAEVDLDYPYPKDHVIAAACTTLANGEDGVAVMVIERFEGSGRQKVVMRKVVNGSQPREIEETADALLKNLLEKKRQGKSRRKYRKGDKINSLDELMTQEFAFFMDKVYHVGWFGSWQIKLASSWIKQGRVFYAVKEEKDEDRKL